VLQAKFVGSVSSHVLGWHMISLKLMQCKHQALVQLCVSGAQPLKKIVYLDHVLSACSAPNPTLNVYMVHNNGSLLSGFGQKLNTMVLMAVTLAQAVHSLSASDNVSGDAYQVLLL
jgi:hypothetical protein